MVSADCIVPLGMGETAPPFRYFVLVADVPNRSGQYKIWHGCQFLADAIEIANWYNEGQPEPITKVVEGVAVMMRSTPLPDSNLTRPTGTAARGD